MKASLIRNFRHKRTGLFRTFFSDINGTHLCPPKTPYNDEDNSRENNPICFHITYVIFTNKKPATGYGLRRTHQFPSAAGNATP